MARPPASPEYRQEQRSRIRRAAAELYQESGAMAVTVRAVSKLAGVSTGTLYSYFANLEELMQSLWVGPVAEAGARLEILASEHADPVDQIRALLGGYVDFALHQPEVFRGAVLFVRPLHGPQPPADPPSELPFYRLLEAAVRAGQTSGQVQAGDPATIAQVLWAGIHGALALPVNMSRYQVQSQVELAGPMIDTLVAAVTAQSSTV